jgi:hypothetical protein
VDLYPGISPDSKLVTEVSDSDVATINRDLRASVSDYRSSSDYFKVLRRGAEFVDVSLEAPTKGDFWGKNSYRIQNGGIHPQRQIFFGPVFGAAVAALASIAGVLAVMSFESALSRRTEMAAKQPPISIK